MKRKRTSLERKLYWRAIVPAYLAIAVWRGLQTWIRLKLQPQQPAAGRNKKTVPVSQVKADRQVMTLQPADSPK